jgi:hypothetical protein
MEPMNAYILKVSGKENSVHDSFQEAVNASKEFQVEKSKLIIWHLPSGAAPTNYWYFDYETSQCTTGRGSQRGGGQVFPFAFPARIIRLTRE